jgi:NADH-quinone oxidoreductase subunit M
MIPAPFPLLSLLIGLPASFALVVLSLPNPALAKKIAFGGALLELLLSLTVFRYFNANLTDFQLVEQYPWIRALNINYMLGVDGISIQFLPLTALLVCISILASWNSVQTFKPLHFALLLILESTTVGAFCAIDNILFYLFGEISAPVIFFLIGLWGIGPQRRSSAIKYILYMSFGSILLLFAFILVALYHASQLGDISPRNLLFNLPELFLNPIEDRFQPLIFLLLLIGFSIKAPLVPFHTWLPSVSMEAPTQLTAILLGLKIGIYGMLRFAMGLAPSAAVQYSWILGSLGAITLIYGAVIALQQSNLRRMLAYASISQIGLVIIGLTSLNMQGIQGTLLQMFNFSLVASCLMLIAGFIQHRLGSTDVIHLGGLTKVMPKLSVFYFLFGLASIGFPGGSIFPAELLLILGALNAHPSLGMTALIGTILSASYMLAFSRRAFFGPITHVGIHKLQDLRKREIALLFLPTLLVLWFGFFPNQLLTLTKASAENWLSRQIDQPILNLERPLQNP